MIFKLPKRESLSEEKKAKYDKWIHQALAANCDCFVSDAELCGFVNVGDVHAWRCGLKCPCECHAD